MAVARIKADAKWHRAAADAIADVPKAARELRRAAERRELLAELHGDEVRELLVRLPGDERVVAAVRDLEEAEERERARPRGAMEIAAASRARRAARGVS